MSNAGIADISADFLLVMYRTLEIVLVTKMTL